MEDLLADKYRRFELIQNIMIHQGELYWGRFTAFATLHAGLFVIATSTGVQGRAPASLIIAGLGIFLSLVWLAVQILALQQLRRYREDYREAREVLVLPPSRGRISASNVAMCVPPVILTVWVVLILI